MQCYFELEFHRVWALSSPMMHGPHAYLHPHMQKLSSCVFAANELYIVERSTEKFDVVSHDMIGSGDPGEQLTWISSRPPGDASALGC
jgi:hypothetical protein